MARNWKKILQAGAIATDALSKGSAGGLGKVLAESKIDLSGKPNIRPEPHNQDVNEEKKKDNYKDK
tara:strand:+ start:168 stop:365 length:198 start_codon:yes stop_codon:yes gene_type:complete